MIRRTGAPRLVALLALLGCTEPRRDSGADAASDTAAVTRLAGTEFLLAAGDSTYWVRVDPTGVRVRSAPLLLAWHDDRWYEVRLEEDIVDYADAEFIRERLWAQALDDARRDSTLLFADDAVANAERAWRLQHPEAVPLDPDTEDAPEPTSSASDFVEVLDVHGPWVSWAHALDVDVVGVGGHEHRRRRGVSSVSTGARATLDSLWSAPEAARLRLAGRAAFDTIVAVIARAGDDDARAAEARRTLGSFRFDESSFSITDVSGAPAVRFHVAGRDEGGEALELTLPPLPVRDVPSWWTAVRATLGAWTPDSTRVRWSRGAFALHGVVDSSGGGVRLSLVSADAASPGSASPGSVSPGSASPGSPPPGAPVASAGDSIAIASVPLPVYQFVDLGAARLSPSVRAALEAAFDRAREGDPFATRAAAPTRRAPFPLVRTRFE